MPSHMPVRILVFFKFDPRTAICGVIWFWTGKQKSFFGPNHPHGCVQQWRNTYGGDASPQITSWVPYMATTVVKLRFGTAI